jgi:hypothetical protein
LYRTKRKYFRGKKDKNLHAHHIVPLHAGGSNDPDNIVFLTVEEHANAHKLLYETYNRWQDKIAWQMLSGQIGKEEAIYIAQKNSDKSWMKTPEGLELMKQAKQKAREEGRYPEPWNKGLKKENDNRLQKSSQVAKQYMAEGKLHCIGDSMRGKEFDNEHKNKLSYKAKNREKVQCEHCKKMVIKQMYVRWHGENCKQNEK